MPYESALVFGFVVLTLASGWAILKAVQETSRAARDRNVPLMDTLVYMILFGLFAFAAYYLMLQFPLPR